ncbi:MAG: Mercuric resistance operon regulatory protein [Chroococcopsis gigantea SAG 12.99]|jgi:MerR family copper efflux transcriptional regulator|nr:Mercuric resistance operon regulatory protein [Chroococcopsis gigantea SAG 12.99]
MIASEQTLLKIGQLSSLTGVSIKTIRYYEELGLISSPQRTEGHFRLFDTDTVNKLLFIKRLQSFGLSLQEIKDCLSVHSQGDLPCNEIKEKLETHINEIDRQIEQLLILRQQLKETVDRWQVLPKPTSGVICPNLNI